MIDRPQGFGSAWIRRAQIEERRLNWQPRFWAKVEKTDGCWLWTAAHTDNGYGGFNMPRPEGGQRFGRAHRIAYELLRGPIPDGRQAHHACNNKLCVNPFHLELLTAWEHGTLHGQEAA